MEEMEVDEFLDLVVSLREEVKAIKKRLLRLEEEVGFEEDFNPDWDPGNTDD
jgi:cell division septum initiation protein DivIVA